MNLCGYCLLYKISDRHYLFYLYVKQSLLSSNFSVTDRILNYPICLYIWITDTDLVKFNLQQEKKRSIYRAYILFLYPSVQSRLCHPYLHSKRSQQPKKLSLYIRNIPPPILLAKNMVKGVRTKWLWGAEDFFFLFHQVSYI